MVGEIALGFIGKKRVHKVQFPMEYANVFLPMMLPKSRSIEKF